MQINILSSFTLLFYNIYPIYGIFFLNWNLKYIILLYFIETIIISIFTLLKMYYLKYADINLLVISSEQRIRKIIGYTFIFTFWLSIAFVFLSILIFENSDVYSYISYLGIFLMVGSRFVSFFTNFIGKQEYEKNSMNGLFFETFFLRIAPIHFFIFTSFNYVYSLDSVAGKYLLSLFIFLKTVFDLLIHIISHRDKKA